ncbi:MAG: 2-amino-4-hydroxy-6-hydroxymethyldihydropteridine diphosphokinase [Chlamydiae bacterium CG10_big_fil_rev_8_21_14_0_10_35_9]|nr:MAG: 2-amino-4-hydroxy-6-hydroxymethyldihydropteridine diphosphokinase [Chlamydiae bacterium CG10_big_fil_rev_8_21_14_0_10_35_9]
MHEVDVFLGLGSNVGSKIKTVQEAILQLSTLDNTRFIKASPLYQTSPVSDIEQEDFINAAVHLKTKLSLEELFATTEKIEKNLGKIAKKKNEPRPIDIDILFFGNKQYHLPTLTVPHCMWSKRLFVLTPLSDIAQEITLKEKGKVIKYNMNHLLENFINVNNEIIKRVL